MIDHIPQPHHSVDDVMRRWPQTMRLFMHHGMACAGCPVGAFHTVEEAALEYRIPLRKFLSELRTVVAEGGGHSAAKPKSPKSRGAKIADAFGRRRKTAAKRRKRRRH